MKKIFRAVLFVFIFTSFSSDIHSQTPTLKTRILFIFDGSQSMLSKWETSNKITVARRLMIKMLDSLRHVPNLEVALRVYGHQHYVPPQHCEDTKLEVPFRPNNYDEIIYTLKTIKPKGTTPIAHSLAMSANDFPPCDHCRNVIILITDGIEACDGDPCEVSIKLQQKGIILKPFIIGVGLSEQFKKTFECVGNYYDAVNEERFQDVLGIVVSQALNNTTMQVNLLDRNGNPTETNVAMTIYDGNTKRIWYEFIHTMNARGFPDTLILNPMPLYKIKVHTIPPVYSDTFRLVPGKHKIVGIDAPQGSLKIVSRSMSYKNLVAIIKKKNTCKILNVQQVNSIEKYIIGNYDIDILTLPRIHINVNIAQSHTTTVEVPNPGMLTINLPTEGYGSIFKKENGENVLVSRLSEAQTTQLFILQPGNYTIVYRSRNQYSTVQTLKKEVKIASGGSYKINLYQ